MDICDGSLVYNIFRYYDIDIGTYISQDPIGLAGGMPNMYSYVWDSNWWTDPFGLSGFIEIIKTAGQQGGDHYKLIYQDGKGKSYTTDWFLKDGKSSFRNGKGRFDNHLVESKKISITKKSKGIVKAVDDFGKEFIKRKNIDCFDYVSDLAKDFGADIKVDPSKSNAENFDNIKCKS